MTWNLAKSVALVVPALATVLAAPAHARTLPEALADGRVDYALRAMLRRADANAHVGAAAAVVTAPSDATGLSDADQAAARAHVPVNGPQGRPTPLIAGFNDGTEQPSTVVYVFLTGDVKRGDLERLGIEVNTQAGGITTAILPLNLVPQLLDVPGLQNVQISFPTQSLLDASAPAIDVKSIWGSNPPSYTGASGRGVVIGIIDTGIDLLHADFRTTSNQTRVKYLWDQGAIGVHPTGFTYGVEYTAAQINAGTCPETDTDGHGTWTAGIAAGNGRATGNSQAAYKYVGIAPEADLIVVKALPYEAGKLDAVNYVFQRAAALGEPAVVNLSFGTNQGAHDGSYALDTGISALTGPGKIVTAAAGNYNGIGLHARVNISSGSATVQFTLPTFTPTFTVPENIYIEGWHDIGSAFDVKLTSPSGISTPVLAPGQTNNNQSTNDGEIYLDNDLASTSRGKRIYAYAYRGVTYHPAAGTWTLTVTRRSGSTSGVCDFWISNWSLQTSGYPQFTGATKDESRTITSPASADSVISSGSYATRTSWTNGSGNTSMVPGFPTLGAIAPYSSLGPRRDGKVCPDLAAPGNDVIAALSATVSPFTSVAWKALDLVHYASGGTSGSSAHTAGAIALLLQNLRTMPPAGARAILDRRAKVDTQTGAVPNNTYGFGKLDLNTGTTAVGDDATRRFSFAPPFPNPSRTLATFEFAITAEDLAAAGSATPTIQLVDVAGRSIRTLAGDRTTSTQHLRWDGKDATGTPAPAGVYFARLIVGPHTAIRKFVRIED